MHEQAPPDRPNRLCTVQMTAHEAWVVMMKMETLGDAMTPVERRIRDKMKSA